MENSGKKVVSGVIWRFFERFGSHAVGFLVTIVLARLLAPEAYGTVALVTAITSLLQVFIDSGFGNALIRKKDADDLDFSSVFYFNIVICVVLYILMFFGAPLIADYYEKPELVALIRVISLVLIISGLKNVQFAYVSRTMQFKKFFWSTLGSTVLSALVGIVMAYCKMGAWALAGQMLVSNGVSTLILWVTVKWRPKRMFSFARLKELIKYGWKILVSGFIVTLYNDLLSLVIGKKYTSADLAYYDRGQKLPRMITDPIVTAVDSALLPAMADEQDNLESLKEMTRKSVKVCAYVMWPIMLGFAVCGESFVSLILSDKWLPCLPYLRLFCVYLAFYPIDTANLNAIKALGRSDLYLILEIIKKVLGIGIIFFSMSFGVFAMVIGMVASSMLGLIIDSFVAGKLLKFSPIKQLFDILPSALLALVMAVVVYFISMILPSNHFIKLIIQVLTGAGVYVLGSHIFKPEAYTTLLKIFKSRKK